MFHVNSQLPHEMSLQGSPLSELQ